MSYIYDKSVGFADTHALTAFTRLRTADSRLLFESRYMYGEGTSTEFNDLLSGSGALLADQPRNCYLANVGTESGARVVRQSKQYHPYIPGTSNNSFMTFTMNAPKANLVQAVGLFDDYNGFILRNVSGVNEVVIRKNGVDSQIAQQSNWNVDRLDGSRSIHNPSGETLDMSKSQILTIDYQWMGFGRVRFGLVMNGVVRIVHQFNHANVITEVYMNQPSLPNRWEIYNIGTTNSTSSLMMVCAAVYCEGSDAETGFSRSVSTDGTTISLTAANSATGYGILGVRLRDVLVGKQNHALARLKAWSLLATNNIQYKVVILPSKAFLNNPSIEWTKVPGYGWCEYIKDFALAAGWNTGNAYSVILDDFAAGATGSSSGKNSIGLLDNRSNAIFQNYDSTDSQILAIIGYRLTQDSGVSAAMNWVEVK